MTDTARVIDADILPWPITRDHIMDCGDVAEAVGISLNTFRRVYYRVRHDQPAGRLTGLPEPFGRVSNAPVWRTHDVKAWLEAKAR